MPKPLEQALKEQMESIQLDDQQLEQLMSMQEASAAPEKTESSSSSRWYMSIAAAVMLMLTGVFFGAQYLSQEESGSMIQRIADEVAMNHLQMKPMEVETSAIGDVQSYFKKLDFLPQLSQLVDLSDGKSLAGGRYCSIQGSTAAQLRYKDGQGGYITLFETPYSPELFKQLPDVDKGQKPVIAYARGVKVKLWVEHGLLMASTEKPES